MFFPRSVHFRNGSASDLARQQRRGGLGPIVGVLLLVSIGVSVITVWKIGIADDGLSLPTTLLSLKDIVASSSLNRTQESSSRSIEKEKSLSSSSALLSSSWFDRLLRQKVKLSPMAVLRSSAGNPNGDGPFTSWEARGGRRGDVAIFYNVYMPAPPIPAADVTHAIAIVHEQITAVAASPISLEPLTLYYNLIGDARAWNESAMQNLCRSKSPHLHCQLLHSYETASESVTLQALHDFCHNEHTNNNNDYRVTYLHTKGAFHESAKNTHWRKLLTHAALHPDCVRPPSMLGNNGHDNESSSSCNLCGLQFLTQFTFFVPGNMFTAHCSYVRKLLPLAKYKVLQEERVRELLLMKLQNQLRSSIIPDQLDYYGMDRYADEHWIGSHPDVRPCDMDPYTDIANIFNGTLQIEELAWHRAPRITGVVGGIGDDRQVIVRNNTALRRREVLLLPGLILRWWKLYRQMPAPSSWIWTFFPDGKFWQDALQTYGARDAVQQVTAQYRSAVDGMSLTTGFQSAAVHINNNDYQVEEIDSLLESRSSSLNSTRADHVVFYHIVLPGRDPTSIAKVTRDVVDQVEMSLISSFSSTAPINLWYSIAGGTSVIHQSIKEKIDATCNASHANNKIYDCRFIGSFDDAYEGESLRLLHRYCTLRPEDAVTYIHNLPPPQWRLFPEGTNNERFIQNLQRAVLGSDCRWSITNDTTCNVCGLIFYNVWTHFFPGNMFTARCDYVQQLLPPQEFEAKMNDLVGDMLLMRLRNIFVTRLFPNDRADILGLHRHALEYWIGSHPNLVPCDLSNATQDLYHWATKRKDTDFHWGLAPRHAESVPLFGSPPITNLNALQQQPESLRLREYYLLPGLIHRWYYLYGKVPAPFAWQWLAAPDGLKWLRATHEYGNRSVLELTSSYAKDFY